MSSNGAFLHIRATKTIQFLQRALSIPLPIIPGSPLCPVMALINHLRLSSVGPSDSLFSVRSPAAQSTQTITYYHFSKFLAKVVTALGFPEIWKEALVFPLLKKPGLDVIFKNFRPVSNLSFVSKLIERAAFNQIHGHLVCSNLYPVASHLIEEITALKQHF